MQQLLNLLQAEHTLIHAILGEVIEAGVQSRAGRDKLFLAEDLLVNHLEREETVLYPFLFEIAENDLKAQQALQALQDDSIGLSMQFLQFFQNLSNGLEGTELQATFDRLLGLLLTRIQRENDELFAMANTYATTQTNP